jgi:rRNA-processing protein FCF1
VDQVTAAVRLGHLPVPVVVVLEGKARDGVPAGVSDDVTILHATGAGDETLVDATADASDRVTLVTADRGLRQRAEALGASVVGPSWLWDLLER